MDCHQKSYGLLATHPLAFAHPPTKQYTNVTIRAINKSEKLQGNSGYSSFRVKLSGDSESSVYNSVIYRVPAFAGTTSIELIRASLV